eukprot:2771001-Rhodomonas_salina.3
MRKVMMMRRRRRPVGPWWLCSGSPRRARSAAQTGTVCYLRTGDGVGCVSGDERRRDGAEQAVRPALESRPEL